jgi:hypothetical protein
MLYAFFTVGAICMAWFHARLTVINCIAKTTTCVHMLNYVITNTVWWSMITMIMYMMFSWGFLVLLFCTARFAFLLRMNWMGVCDQYDAIKKLMN